ncbi:MAG: DinB family protein [Chloroflexota bacterium]|nr:DinB family protein [Chloroflexota bacterium]
MIWALLAQVSTHEEEQMSGRFDFQAGVEVDQYSKQMLHTLFDYSIWARDKFLPVIASLDEAQLTDGAAKGVYGSIHSTLTHMASSEWLWIQRCLGESPMRLWKGEDFPNLDALVSWWNEVHAGAIDYLAHITAQRLGEQITYTAPDGKVRIRPIWHMLLQVPNHQTEHRAQIGTMLGQLGMEVPQTDMVVYFSDRAEQP